jgi:outer membrane protein assembly factor BamB
MEVPSTAGSSTDVEPIANASTYRPLRVWFLVLVVPLMIAARYFSDWFPEIPMVWMVGAFVPGLLGLLTMIWWLTFSRAKWTERLVGLLGVVAAIATALFFVHPTMLGPPIIVLTLPTTTAAFALTLLVMSSVLSFRRTYFAVASSFLVAGFSTLLTNDGATGDFSFGFDWRWRPTAEESFLTNRLPSESIDLSERPTADSFANPLWPGFRGPNRDGIQLGMTFESDWKAFPPLERWRIKLGPAWSSFAVADKFLVTQEQRGEHEAVVCYNADTGREVWSQEIKSRFFDALGGLGPRATPTIASGSVFAMGAEGWLVKLNAVDGSILWKTDVRDLTQLPPPMWGFSCSPLVVGDLVVIHAGGNGDQGIIAFETDSGKVRWSVSADKESYSSLHLTSFFDQQQIVFLGSHGATFLDPATGRTLLNHEFKITGYRAVQPAVIDSTKLLFTSEYAGSRLIELKPAEQGLDAVEVWTSRSFKPDFNDLVIQAGYAYGFDGAIFTCIDLKDGSRSWRKGRYGKGQVILLAESKKLLVISETGELVLLEATPERHLELAKLTALDGKTWNHPVVVGDRLYLRNANEAVCYQLPQASAQLKPESK